MCVRFSPSPTGTLSSGNLKIFKNLLFLNLKCLKLIKIKIDDTDKNRIKLNFIKNLIKNLNKFNYFRKKIIIFQSNKNYYYNEISVFLYKKKKINYFKNNKFNFFLKVYKIINNFIHFKKKIKKKSNFFKINLIKLFKKNFFIFKLDKISTYNFSSIIDDLNINTKFIIRGTDHTNNIKKQLFVINILKKKYIKIIHNSLIMSSVGKKLSKRNINFYKNHLNHIENNKNLNIKYNLKNLDIKFKKNSNIKINNDLNVFIKFFNFKSVNYINLKSKFNKLILNLKFKNLNLKYKSVNKIKLKKINKINFLNIKILKKILFIKSYKYINFVSYLKKLLIFEEINFNFYFKVKKFKILIKKFNISIKILRIYLKSF